MRLFKNTLLILLALLFLASCKEGKKTKKNIEAIISKDTLILKDSTITKNTIKEKIENKKPKKLEENITYKPSDDELVDYGTIEKIEEGAYPLYTVTINFFRSKHTIDFKLNIEDVTIDSNALLNSKGKNAKVYYTSEFVNDLSDIYFNGKSLSGEYAPEIDEEWKKMTGTLSGAENLSGDLPSKIYVTDSEGTKLEFEWFIDDDVISANEKEVTIYYTTKAESIIKHIDPYYKE